MPPVPLCLEKWGSWPPAPMGAPPLSVSKYDILKTNEPVLMPTGTSGPRGHGIKRSTLGARRSKNKVTWNQNSSQKSLSARYLKNYPTNFNRTWQAHLTVNAHCHLWSYDGIQICILLLSTETQKVKGQDHTKLQIIRGLTQSWKPSFSTPFGSISFSSFEEINVI